ncbi:TetR/AcrR family transcriptional regulator [Motilibacter rhizosphaerae]|uniref:TetR/AcrR family transcriptional regulator n=1 Tax=Motilibacter rhizosphaerae TaxID=598652 RepID=UPI001E2EAA1B|nr:TetR family transcriptional regulator [Motilibacter rhizosphaerae]
METNATALNSVRARRGRRPGPSDTRERLLAAARTEFAEHGYQRATMRAVAAAAGVDVKLVAHYFGSKKGLFGAAMELPVNPAAILGALLEGDVRLLPERIVASVLQVWDDPVDGPLLRTLMLSALHDEAMATALREYIEREVFDRLAERLPGPHARARAAAGMAQIAGLIFARYLLQVGPVAAMPAGELAAQVVPALRTALGLDPRRRPGR